MLINWNKLGHRMVNIKVAVLNATDPDKRVGYVIVNLGGLGGTTILLLIAYLEGS